MSLKSAVTTALLSAAAAAQPCTPEWDGTLGRPGLDNGYIGPIFVWDDGGGDDLYVGGSFSSIAGRPFRVLSRLNAATGNWQQVGTGISTGFTNGYATKMIAYDPGTGEELIVAGFWAEAVGVPESASLARWNGSRWDNLGAGWTSTNRSAVWGMTVWNDVLYVGGGFTDIADLIGANGIAAWDGETWSPVGSGFDGGFSPNVFALQVHDDGSGEKLYAGGRFSSLAGIPGMIARWTGSTWEAVGGGVAVGSTFAGIETLVVFNGELYAGGWDLRVGGINYSVAKWNGTQWSGVGQYLGGRTTSLIVWDDGSGPALYAGGTAQPGINYLARLEGNQWEIYAGGVGGAAIPPGNFPSVFGLGTWEGNLVVGGSFTGVGPGFTELGNGLAVRTTCVAPPCRADLTGGSDPNDPNYGAPNGIVDIDDFFYFLDQFVAGNLAQADLTSTSDPNDPGYGVPDGQLDIADFFYYLDLFVLGCP